MVRRLSIVAAVAVLGLLVAAQFALPPIAEHEAEKRLTKDGGTADVQLSAVPAVRLLFREGDRLRVRARGVDLPIVRPDEQMLKDLDGFDQVDVAVTDAHAGPFRLSSVTLTRDGDSPYRTAIHGTVNGRDLGTFAGGQVGGPIGGFFGGLAGGAMPFGDEDIPVDLTAVIRSDGGRPRAVTANGTVGGVPAGPLVEALAQALAGRF